ncbi:terpene utilization protein AtuA [Alteromonas mediterranea]|uniref:acyclic terpene utilization AtuA family protein n=1 Tax=Alteromonas mediterranea TaxID=314275 RepID=UPI00090406F7|nr:acyclic terpene utilization AtuA family protein [Alteromonas mediterranea]APE00458.1 terpene utilization protein AtuA [Alteromonas mediterranea]
MNKSNVRIGGASAFYGDSQLSARQLVEKGDIDYLVFDYLAEVTMAILSQAKTKNENLGYAVDFVTVAMKDVLQDCATKKIKIVANAGGVNVPACVEALNVLCESLNLNLNIAGVSGDNLLSDTRDSVLKKANTDDIDSGNSLPDTLASMNAYLGAQPIAEALTAGADIVVTGRVVDSALVLGPLIHEFSWRKDDYNTLAQGALAGHLLECGAQCTGGNFTDWEQVPNFSDMSYPIAEVEPNGEFAIVIPPQTGGLVTTHSVAEQLLYEIGDPANYRLPDVCCDFTRVTLQQVEKNAVRVTGALGASPGNYYKVCATYIDGYKLSGTFFIAGFHAKQKALANIHALLARTEHALQQKGLAPFSNTCIEILGSEATFGPHALAEHTREVIARFTLHHHNIKALYFCASEMAYLATSAAPGMSGFGTGRPKPQPLIRVHSFLVSKEDVAVTIQRNQEVIKRGTYEADANTQLSVGQSYAKKEASALYDNDDVITLPLVELVCARSGDKGDNLNIGVVARSPELLTFLYHNLTAEAVKDFFTYSVKGQVTRYELPGINGFNFLLTQALGGGGTASLRTDSQGKSAAQTLLTMPINVPTSLVPFTKSKGE